MKNRDFREMRREEKRRQLELKRQRRENARQEEHDKLMRRREREEARQAWVDSLPETFVGRLEYVRRGGVVFIESKVLHDNIIVPTPYLNGAQEGDKVVVRLLYPERAYYRRHHTGAMPEGEVVDVLGPDGDNNTEMHAILAEFGLPYSYPEELERQADAITAGITPEEVRRRRDMRDILTFTIDPRDAKDFDDALSFRRLEDGSLEVGVHIADVTHYVTPGTDIDREGYNRGTSVYLVDRTIPMLPEHLSNGICSLRPNEDKLTFSVLFRMDENANVLSSEILRTVTRSDRRLCYEEAQLLLEKEAPESPLEEALMRLNELAKILRQRRMDRGSINFEHDEVKFDLDEAGKPLRIFFKTAQDSNHLIEEFMLLANKTVALYVGKEQQRTMVYRVHDLPDPDKMKNLSQFIKRFGYSLKTTSTRMATVSKNLNSLLHSVAGQPEQDLIETVAVRAMAKAVYSTDNIGHYGLAFPYYTHFTSPIRRYPDMMVHRLLADCLAGRPMPRPEVLEDSCQHCSRREQLAANAERASVKYKQVEFMQDCIGRTYEGMITGVTDWGIYVEITENKCEGLIPLRQLMPRDYYNCYDTEYCVRGERTGTLFTLGDKIRIRVEGADLLKRQLDFVKADE